MRAAIQVDRLRKSYGSHVVLNGLNFCVRQGEIFALLGVNGAGKTTALECIEGLRKFDEGSHCHKRTNGHPVAVRFFTGAYQAFGSSENVRQMESDSS